jgi:hypothetical protein
MRRAGHRTHMGEKRYSYNILAGNPTGKRPLVRPRRRWKDIKVYLKIGRV